MQNKARPYLTPNEVASLLMVAPGTVRTWADKGLLRAQTTVGGHRRFLRDEVERFIKEYQTQGVALPSKVLRILIVDDDANLLRYLAALIGGVKNVPVEIATAHDGFEAGRMLHAFDPDIILLDLVMPGIDGFHVCRQIRQDPLTCDKRVIAMTGDASPENTDKAIQAGAEYCLAKPLDDEKLLNLLGL